MAAGVLATPGLRFHPPARRTYCEIGRRTVVRVLLDDAPDTRARAQAKPELLLEVTVLRSGVLKP